jgi:hypothetical protein
MEVGAIIEEKDILDIQEALDRTTHRDVIRVYTSLLAGSYSHLTAFNDQLTKLAGGNIRALSSTKTYQVSCIPLFI